MIYKNAIIYSLATAQGITVSTEQLEPQAFEPCRPFEPKSAGFVPPLPGGTDLVHEANGTTLVCLQIQERILPPAVINKALAEEVARIEEEQERKVYRKEKLAIKDAIIERLLPQAFTKDKRILGHIDHHQGLVIIDTASPKTAEAMLNHLRGAIGSLPATILTPNKSPPMALGSLMLNGHYSRRIRASLEAKLGDPEGAGTITIKNEELHSEEVRAHIDVGMLPQEVRVAMDETARYTITDDLAVKRIRLSDELIHGNSGDLEDSAKLDADYQLNVQTLREIYQELHKLFDIESEGETAACEGDPVAAARETLARHEATVSIIDPEGRETPIGTTDGLRFRAGAR